MQQQAIAIAKAIEVPDAVLTYIGNFGAIAFNPVYQPFKQQLYASPAAPYVRQMDQFLAGYAKSNPWQSRYPALESAAIIFMCLSYVVFFWLLPLVIFKFVIKTPLNFLRPVAKVHNVLLTLLSGYMAFGIAVTAVASGYSFWNNPFDTKHPLAWSMSKFQFLFYISKPWEFLDTLLMICLRNFNQLTVLHVSHHVSVPVIWFFVMNIAPTGDCHASSFANSFVHFFMYMYMALCLFFPKKTAVRNFLDKNKFAVTFLQIIQFMHNVAQGIFTLYFVQKTMYEPFLIKLMVAYCSYLELLFLNFLIQNIGKKKEVKAVEGGSAAGVDGNNNNSGRNTAARTSASK